MQSSAHLGNIFSDDEEEENSFDNPVPGSKDSGTGKESSEDECKETIVEKRELDLGEEDFDMLTIEKVPMDVLKSRIGRVVTEVLYRGEAAAIALFDVANKIVFQSTMLDVKKNTVIATIIQGLTCVLLDNRERDQDAEKVEHILMIFTAKLSIKNKSMKCSDLLIQLILLIDRHYSHSDSSVRSSVCRLIACLVEEANRYTDIMREHGDNVFLFTDEVLEEEEMIPNGVKIRWFGKLTKSLLDKSPQVRSKALIALSLWDHGIVCKTSNGDETTVNELIWKSVHDIDETVRLTAARRIHITEEKDIDKCTDFIENSKDNRVRLELIVRLASDVHLFSLSEKQRFRLVNLLNDSESVRVRDVIHQRLVDSWMMVAGREIVSPSVFTDPDPDHEIPSQFPSIIMEYLNPFVDASAAYVLMKSATIRFIRLLSGQQSNSNAIELFMKECLKMTSKDSESVGLMRRSTFSVVLNETPTSPELKNAFLRILISRCFIDVIFDMVTGRLDADLLRNRALMFFLPDVVTFVDHLKQFCSVYFKERKTTEDHCKELLLHNVFHLINTAVKYGNSDVDHVVYKEGLMQLLENPVLEFSEESVLTMVTTCLDLCTSSNEIEDMCNWICDTANRLFVYKSTEQWKDVPDLVAAMTDKSVLDRMYFRSSIMLLATCKHEDVKKPTTRMTVLFQTIIKGLLGHDNKTLQKIGFELIGFATLIDFTECELYIQLTQILIKRDDEDMKSAGLSTLIRIIKSHGFEKTAIAIFSSEVDGEKECQDCLAKLFETALVSLHGGVLVQTVPNYLSMLSYGRYAWPNIHCVLLLITFRKTNEHLPLARIFKAYCKKSVRSDFSKMNMLVGFIKAINIISGSNENDANCNIVAMTELVCEFVSSVQIIEEDGEEIHKKKKSDHEMYLEIELADKMVSRAVSHPSGWFNRHVFTAMATSLRLESVPMKRLDELRETLIDAYTVVRFNSSKTTLIAFKRFMTHCEKVISMYERMNGLSFAVDMEKVKLESPGSEEIIGTSSFKSSRSKKKQKKESWDDDEVNENADDSFEYFPKSTRSRKRQSCSIEVSPTKKTRIESDVVDERNVKEEINLDDSFEL